MIKNRGSISLLGITSLFFLSLLSLHLIYLHSWRIKDSKQQIKLKLCSKKFFNQAKSYQKKMDFLNMSLKTLNITKIALIPLLPESILAIKRISNLIKTIIQAQNAFSIYEKGKLNYLILKKCHLNISPQFSFFYKSKGLKLVRDNLFDQAQLEKEWRGYFCQGRHLLSIRSKEANPNIQLLNSSKGFEVLELITWLFLVSIFFISILEIQLSMKKKENEIFRNYYNDWSKLNEN